MAAKSKAKVWPQECHQWDFSNLTAHKNTQMGRWIWIITWEWDRLPNSETRPRWLVTVVGKPPPAGHQLVNPNAPHFHLWIYIIIFPCCTFFCIMYTLCIVFYLHILYISLSYPAPRERERDTQSERERDFQFWQEQWGLFIHKSFWGLERGKEEKNTPAIVK